MLKGILPEKFSNSDENGVRIKIQNTYGFKVYSEVIDEIPVQFQKRDFLKTIELPAHNTVDFEYSTETTEARRIYFREPKHLYFDFSKTGKKKIRI